MRSGLPRFLAVLAVGGLALTVSAPNAGTEPAAGAPLLGEAPTLSLTLIPQQIHVGDLVEAVLEIELDIDAGEPSFPNWQRHWGDAEIRNVGEVVRNDEGDATAGIRARYSQTVLITSFRPGSVSLPPQRVTIGAGEGELEIFTEPRTFEIGTVLPEGEESLEPKPPAPPRSLPLGSRFWWTVGLLAALATALLAVALSRRRSDLVYAGKALDPWEALEAALAGLANAADAETVFTGLSLELRRYLGRTLAFPAAESTTTELRRRLLGSGLPASVCSAVVRLLVEADSVKFAKKGSSPDRLAQCLEQTRVAATEVRDFLRPTDPSEEGEEAA